VQLSETEATLTNLIRVRFSKFEKTKPIGVAVSGGGDSMALLQLLADAGLSLRVATVDHGLRPEAKDEACFVGGICAKLGVPHEVLRWDDPTGAGNLQSRAREARYSLLAAWAKRHHLSEIMLGHTSDDVAENFLMRLARGSGLDGLAAMELRFTRNDTVFHRPLLETSRGELRAFLIHRGLKWCDDPSNEDPAFDRVKARKILAELVPLGIETDKISRAASNLRDAKHIDVLVAIETFAQNDAEIRRRIFGHLVQWISGSPYPARADGLARLDSLLSKPGKMTLDGVLVVATNEKIRLMREHNAVKETVSDVQSDWDRRWRLIGPDGDHLQIRALGEKGLALCPDWRATGIPLANFTNGWQVELLRTSKDLFSAILSH